MASQLDTSTPLTSGSPSFSASSSTPRRAPKSRPSTSHSHSRTSTPYTLSGRTSRATSTFGGSENHQIICAVSEARGVSPSVGIAIVNITTGDAILSQICDTQFYIRTIHKIHVHEPSRILVIASQAGSGGPSKLTEALKDSCLGIPIIPLDRKYWSETAGLESINDLAFREIVDAIMVAIDGNYFATCSFAAVMRYMELEFSIRVASHSLRIRYQPSEEAMMIDLSAITSLELIQNIQRPASKDCLFGLLNQTLTPMGKRMLRASILQPSTEVEGVLNPRYDAVEELSSKEDMFFMVRKALKGFLDAEKLLTGLIILPTRTDVSKSEQAINNVLMLKKFLQDTAPVFESLMDAKSPLLVRIRDVCRSQKLAPVLDLITNTINEDAIYTQKPIDLRNQRTYAVKSGIKGFLDVARKTYKEATDDLYQLVQDLNGQLELAGEVCYDNSRKYYLRFRAVDLEDREIPEELVNRVKKRQFIECQTLMMIKYNQRIASAADEVTMMSDNIIEELLDTIRSHISLMFRVCESVAMLDMLASFSYVVTTQDYARPDMSGTLALKSARHPIIEKCESNSFIPNDYYATDSYRLQIVTGCNMSGKSTYIRTVALLQVMAQIGCFVPAQYGAFPVIEHLFVRVSTDDNIEANMSTFSIEMREMAFILRNVGPKSLAIIDELGRGTSTNDGLAIAIAMAEALLQSGSLVFFSTHFIELAHVLADQPGVLNSHLAIEISDQDGGPRMTMLYKASAGPMDGENYGIDLARAIGFPAGFINVAEETSKYLRERAETKRQGSNSRRLVQRRKLVLNLYDTLLHARDSTMEDDVLADYLRELQKEFILRLQAIETAGSGEAEAEAGELSGSDAEA
ncbi:hypothetical protein GQ53DRAFT_794774 [Thozetella sp. PMI_491]|nr:hypothetical protein GQ53DRAFT_794774 [Thozetella sp. PMI_491]